MTTPITIAHLTDVHLGPIAGLRAALLEPEAGGRLLQLDAASPVGLPARRARSHRRRHAGSSSPTTSSSPATWPTSVCRRNTSTRWRGCRALGPPERVSVIPGNHDIYSRIGRDPGTRRWAPYMASDAQGADFVGRAERIFRSCACWDRWRSSASTRQCRRRRSWPGDASDASSLRAVAEALAAPWSCQSVPRRAHPPSAAAWPGFACARLAGRSGTGSCPGRGMAQSWSSTATITSTCWPGARGRPAGSRSSARRPRHWAEAHRHEPLGRYNLYRIDPATRCIELVGRGLAEPGGPIVELERRTLVPRSPAQAEGIAVSIERTFIGCSARQLSRSPCESSRSQ